jgi:hypothetical protein
MYHDVTEITRGKNQQAEKDTGIEQHQEKYVENKMQTIMHLTKHH